MAKLRPVTADLIVWAPDTSRLPSLFNTNNNRQDEVLPSFGRAITHRTVPLESYCATQVLHLLQRS